MQRRSFLGAICAAVGGLFTGKVAATDPERIKPAEQKPRLLTGSFNVPDGKGGVLPWTKACAADLVWTCLDALREVNYVICVPFDALPHVEWNNTDPLTALCDLSQQLGLGVLHDLACDRATVDVNTASVFRTHKVK